MGFPKAEVTPGLRCVTETLGKNKSSQAGQSWADPSVAWHWAIVIDHCEWPGRKRLDAGCP